MSNSHKCYCLLGDYDELKHKVSVLFQRALALRGVLNLYVYNNENAVSVDSQFLAYCLWDIQDPFCDMLKSFEQLLDASTDTVSVDLLQEVDENGCG